MKKRKEDPVRAEMRRLYEDEYWSLRELAAKFGLTHEGVRYKLLAGGTDMRAPQIRPRGVRGRPIDSEEIRHLYVEEILPIGEIAIRLNATRDRVDKELERLGLGKRPRGFFSRKHRNLAGLKIGQWIEVEPASAGPHKPHGRSTRWPSGGDPDLDPEG